MQIVINDNIFWLIIMTI